MGESFDPAKVLEGSCDLKSRWRPPSGVYDAYTIGFTGFYHPTITDDPGWYTHRDTPLPQLLTHIFDRVRTKLGPIMTLISATAQGRTGSSPAGSHSPTGSLVESDILGERENRGVQGGFVILPLRNVCSVSSRRRRRCSSAN